MDNNENMILPEAGKDEGRKKEQENPNVKDDNSAAEQFGGLPIESLINKPIVAAAQGQQELTAVYIDGIKKLAYKGESESETNTMEFTYELPVMNPYDLQAEPIKKTIKAPLLSLVPVPAFTMDELSVDFDMEVKSKEMSDSRTHEDASATVNYNSWFGLEASVTGHISSDTEHKRQTDCSATYKIHAQAVQQPPSEGMEKLTELLSQAMEPIKKDSEKE